MPCCMWGEDGNGIHLISELRLNRCCVAIKNYSHAEVTPNNRYAQNGIAKMIFWVKAHG